MNKLSLQLIILWSTISLLSAKEQGLFSYEDLKLSAQEAVAISDWDLAQEFYLEHSLASLQQKNKKAALSSFEKYLETNAQVENLGSETTLKNYREYLQNGGLDDLTLKLKLISYLQSKEDFKNAEKFIKSTSPDSKESTELLLELNTKNSIYLAEIDKAIAHYQKLISITAPSSSKFLAYQESLLLLYLSQKKWTEAQGIIATQFAQGEIKKVYYELYIALGLKDLKQALLKFKELEESEVKTSKLAYSQNTLTQLHWQLRVNKQYPDALRVINKIIADSPATNSQLLILKSDTLLENKAYDEALKLYQKYLLEETNTEWLAEIQLNVGHLLKIQKDENAQAKALEAYQKSFEIAKVQKNNKLAYQASLHSAQLLIQNQRFEEALEAFMRASSIAETDEDKTLAYCLAGQLEFDQATLTNNKEQFAQASVHFRKALDLESSLHQQALLHYGFSMRAAGLHDKALEAFTKLRATQFEAADSIYLQGLALIEAGQVLKGVKQLIFLAKKHPTDPRANNGLLSALKAATFKLKGKNRADLSTQIIKSYSQLTKNTVNAPLYLHLKALNSWYQNKDNQALKDWQQFSSLYPEHPLAIEVQLWQAFSYYKSKDFEKALELYEFIEKSYSQNLLVHQALYQQAKIKLDLKEQIEAGKLSKEFIARFEELLNKNQKFKELNQIHFIYGQSLSYSRNFEAAEEQFNKVIQSPQIDNQLDTLALAKLADNNYRSAFSDKETLIEKLKETAQLYKNLAELSPQMRVQSLYKQALCYIKIAQKSQDPVQQEKSIEEASTILSTLIFQIPNVDKENPYYFARACYELGRIFIKNEQKLSAKAVYQKLVDSRVAGYQQAKIILEKLKSNTKKR